MIAIGAALAGFAGAMMGAIQSVQVGMGEPVLILAFVVIVIGGIGSIKGALVGAILVGLTDTHVSFTYRKKSKRPSGQPSLRGPRRTMSLPALEFLRRFLQHVSPRGLQRVRHYGFLSRASKVDLDDLRSIILRTMTDSEPDLELINWTVPVLRPSSRDASGPLCPTCGSELTFDSFIRIRPPPLEWRV